MALIDFFLKRTAPIFHMSSFSRSGETLVLRCLNAHPQIEVVHQVKRPDIRRDLVLSKALRNWEETKIRLNDPLVLHRHLAAGQVLLLKNATWLHSKPRRGFTLVRNPFSVVASGNRDVVNPERDKKDVKKLQRWARGIDPPMLDRMADMPTMDFVVSLYARKLLKDREDGLPFVRYEDFVQNPEVWLRKIVAHLELDWSDKVLTSHERYAEGEYGHGGIKLWQPIHAGSLDKYKRIPTDVTDRIQDIAGEVLSQFGYHWDGETVSLRKNVDGLL